MTKTANTTTAATTPVKHMRLTNHMREAFVSAVMADLPVIDYEQKIRDAFMKAHAASIPVAVKKILADEELSSWVKREGITLSKNRGSLPRDCYISFYGMVCGDNNALQSLAKEVAAPFVVAWHEQVERIAHLSKTLRCAANNCNTTTQLADAYPEFNKYLPKSEAEVTRNLPAVANLVGEFTKAGWPSGGKKTAG